jgi:hypothetical protein
MFVPIVKMSISYPSTIWLAAFIGVNTLIFRSFLKSILQWIEHIRKGKVLKTIKMRKNNFKVSRG